METFNFYDGPPDYDRLRRIVCDLTKKYADLSCECIGKSVLGREIFGLRLGSEHSENVLFAGAFHGMEWLTSLVLLKFLDKICSTLSSFGSIAEIDVSRALSGRSLFVVPCVNPDGVEISLNGAQSAGECAEKVLGLSGGDTLHWQANARGVDINHNFNAGWQELHCMEQEKGICGPALTRYGGPCAESEPETQALTNLCRKTCFRHVLAFHSQGEEIYWHYGCHTPRRSLLMAQVMSMASGYTIAMPEPMASHGGFKDWFIEEMHRPGFTVEIGKGENPLPLSDLDGIYRQLEEMLILSVLI